jgi:hypothetical protein
MDRRDARHQADDQPRDHQQGRSRDTKPPGESRDNRPQHHQEQDGLDFAQAADLLSTIRQKSADRASRRAATSLSVPLRIPGSHRALGLDPNATPQFTTTPGQVAFTPDGAQLVVTTKGNGNDIDVFGVGFGGLLSAKATVNSEPGTVPFAIAFDPFGHLAIAEAGPNALATFDLSRNGTVSLLSQAGTGQAATCWVTLAGAFLFASNAGRLEPEDLTPQMRDEFTDLYGRWRSERQ